MALSFPSKPYKTHGGANVPHHKNTSRFPSVTMPAPKQVIIPMQQHVGAPCTPLVKKGDHVYRGQKIGDSSAFVSAPVHASVSGTVSAVEKVLLPGGQACEAVVIDSDGLMESLPDLTPPIAVSYTHLDVYKRQAGGSGMKKRHSPPSPERHPRFTARRFRAHKPEAPSLRSRLEGNTHAGREVPLSCFGAMQCWECVPRCYKRLPFGGPGHAVSFAGFSPS